MKEDKPSRGSVGKPIRILGICRVSTQEQARKGASLESQEHWVNSKASELKGEIVVVRKFEISGERLPKEECDSILEFVEKEGINHILVYTFDRMSRNVPYGSMLVQKLWDNGVQIVTSTMSPNLGDPNDRFYVWLAFAFAEMEQGTRNERVSRGMITKLTKGEFPLPHVPFGFERVDCKIRLLLEYKPVIVFIFETLCKVKSYAETSRIVNEMYGSKMDFELSPQDIKNIVRSKVYIGYLEWNGMVFGKEGEPNGDFIAVEKELFEKTQQIVRRISIQYDRGKNAQLNEKITECMEKYGPLFAIDNLPLKPYCPECGGDVQHNGNERVNGTMVWKLQCTNKDGYQFRIPTAKQLKRIASLEPKFCRNCASPDRFNYEKGVFTVSVKATCTECGHTTYLDDDGELPSPLIKSDPGKPNNDGATEVGTKLEKHGKVDVNTQGPLDSFLN